MSEPLTDRQRECLDLLVEAALHGEPPPTMREIGEAMGIKSINGVGDHLRAKRWQSRPRRRVVQRQVSGPGSTNVQVMIGSTGGVQVAGHHEQGRLNHANAKRFLEENAAMRQRLGVYRPSGPSAVTPAPNAGGQSAKAIHIDSDPRSWSGVSDLTNAELAAVHARDPRISPPAPNPTRPHKRRM